VRKETVGQCERILDDNVSSGELSSLDPPFRNYEQKFIICQISNSISYMTLNR
jgi:hypothetical protein